MEIVKELFTSFANISLTIELSLFHHGMNLYLFFTPKFTFDQCSLAYLHCFGYRATGIWYLVSFIVLIRTVIRAKGQLVQNTNYQEISFFVILQNAGAAICSRPLIQYLTCFC